MSSILALSSAQLKRAADIKDQIEALEKELASLAGSAVADGAPVAAKRGRPRKVVSLAQFGEVSLKRKKGGMSAAGKARIAAAQRLRWAKVKALKEGKSAPKAVSKPAKGKRTMSAAAKAAISAAAKVRWAKVRAAKKA